MTADVVRDLLGWSTLINSGFLLAWFLLFWFGHDWMHRHHSTWFRLSRETFDALQYGALAGYKLAIILFNLVPYLALRIVV